MGLIPLAYTLLPKTPSTATQIIKIAPIEITSNHPINTDEETLKNLERALLDAKPQEHISKEEEAQEILLSLKERLNSQVLPTHLEPTVEIRTPKVKEVQTPKPIKVISSQVTVTPTKTPVQKERQHKEGNIPIKALTTKKVANLEKREQKQKMMQQDFHPVALEPKEEEIDINSLPLVQTLGVVETKQYVVPVHHKIENKISYDGEETAKFNRSYKGEGSKQELEHLAPVKTLGVVKVEAL